MSSHILTADIQDLSILNNGLIVEIGSAREANGPESSTFFFNELAKKVNAEFYSVDFSPDSQKMAFEILGKNSILSDGKNFLRNISSYSDKKISLLYLDNFDVIYSEKHKESLYKRVGSAYNDNNEVISNERSAQVHLEQMIEALPRMGKKSVVIVDDTKKTESGWWGKGAKVVPFLLLNGFHVFRSSTDGILMINFDCQSVSY